MLRLVKPTSAGHKRRPKPRRPNRQKALHRIIADQSRAIALAGVAWDPKDFPELWGLLQAAIAEARRRIVAAARKQQHVRGPVCLNYEGKRYTIIKTSLDRLLVRDHRTGADIATTGFFAI